MLGFQVGNHFYRSPNAPWHQRVETISTVAYLTRLY